MPFEVPESWVWQKLGDIGVWQSGATPSRLNKDYYGGDIPWLKTGDLNDGYIYEIPETITQKALKETSVKLNPAGSVLIAMYGATIGKIGILTYPATTNQACCACVDYQGIEQMYLFYFLLSHREEFIMLGGGGAQPNISKEKIADTFIPIPPLIEQQRLVKAIELWFALIDKLETAKVDLQTSIFLAKSKILDLAIHGKLVPQDPNDEPAAELLRRINPKFTPCDNGHYSCQLPNSWMVASLSDCLVEILNGFAFQSSKYSINGIRIIRITNVQDGYIEDETPKFYPLIFIKDINKYILKANDLLMSLTGNVGRVGFLPENLLPAALNQRVGCIRSNNHIIYDKYLFYIFLTDMFKKDCLASGKGVAQLNISTEWLKNYVVPLPPYNEQLRIVAKIEEIFAALDKIQKSIED